MPDYEKLYHTMFNAVTDAERKLETATIILRVAQQQCEDLYIEAKDEQVAADTAKENPALEDTI